MPLDFTVTVLETAVPTVTLPKASELALRLSAGVAASSCNGRLCEDEFALAVRMSVCVVVTDATVAVNDAVEDPLATVTLAGTVTTLALLARVTF